MLLQRLLDRVGENQSKMDRCQDSALLKVIRSWGEGSTVNEKLFIHFFFLELLEFVVGCVLWAFGDICRVSSGWWGRLVVACGDRLDTVIQSKHLGRIDMIGCGKSFPGLSFFHKHN